MQKNKTERGKKKSHKKAVLLPFPVERRQIERRREVLKI
jgi:hypothetical protein